MRADAWRVDRLWGRCWSGISSIPLYGGNPGPNADASLLRDAPCSLNPCWSAGGRSAGGSAFGPLLVRDFFYPPSMEEIPCQTRTLRSLFPIPPSSLPHYSSGALKTRPLASLGNFVRSLAWLDSRFSKNPAGTRANARWADRFSGRCWSGISSIPLYGGNPVPNADASLPFSDSSLLVASLFLC